MINNAKPVVHLVVLLHVYYFLCIVYMSAAHLSEWKIFNIICPVCIFVRRGVRAYAIFWCLESEKGHFNFDVFSVKTLFELLVWFHQRFHTTCHRGSEIILKQKMAQFKITDASQIHVALLVLRIQRKKKKVYKNKISGEQKIQKSISQTQWDIQLVIDPYKIFYYC